MRGVAACLAALVVTALPSTAFAELVEDEAAYAPDAGDVDAGFVELPLVEDAGEPAPSSLGPPPETVLDVGPPPDLMVDADAGVLEEPDAGVDGKKSETVVVGTRLPRTAGSVHVLKDRELQRFERDDPHAILRTVPGVYARGEDGFGLRPNVGIRGGNSDRSKKVTLLEDGVLFGPAPYSAPAAYYFPLMTRMRSVRILKGPSAIVQGPQTVGGAVELLTQEIGVGEKLTVDVSGGRFGAGKVHGVFGYGGESAGALVEGLHLRNAGFKTLDGGGSTGFSRNEWMVKAHRLLSSGAASHRFSLKVGYSDEDSNETYLGLTDADFAANPDRRYLGSQLDHMKWHRTQLVLRHDLSFGELSVTTQLYRHDLDRTWRKLNRFRGAAVATVLANPESSRNRLFYDVLTGAADAQSRDEALMIGPNHRVFVSQGLQSVARLSFDTGPLTHAFEAGARWHYDRAEREHTEDAFLVRGGELHEEGSATLTTAENRDSTHAVALHAMDVLSYGRFSLTGGGRLEVLRSRAQDDLQATVGYGGALVFLPGAAAHVALTEELGVFAGLHKGFSPPQPGEPSATPESSVNYEAGARYAAPSTRLEVLGFFSDYSNLTTLCTFSAGCTTELDAQFSAGAAHIFGLEAQAEKTVRGFGLQFPLQLSYTFTQTELLTSFTSADPQLGRVTAGDELPYVPEHQLHGSAGIEHKRFALYLSATYAGAMREKAGQGTPLPGEVTDALLTFDAAAHVKISDQARIYLTGQNLASTRGVVSRRPFGARPNAPLFVQLGVKYDH